MAEECIFCKIAKGVIPADKLYEDKDVVAFRDAHPVAPTHLLIIPKKHYPTLNDLPDEVDLMSKMYNVARKLAKKEGIAESGYRTVINTNSMSGQVVFHLHMHLLGGRELHGLG